MKAILGITAVLIAATVNAAEHQPDVATSDGPSDPVQDDVIVVEARLAEELKDTTLVMVRGRNNRATFKFRADGTFVSEMNGQQSDFGRWFVEGNAVCLDGRRLDVFCAPNLLDRRPGDTWMGIGYDGREWESSLLAND